jgi:hypothetical protein
VTSTRGKRESEGAGGLTRGTAAASRTAASAAAATAGIALGTTAGSGTREGSALAFIGVAAIRSALVSMFRA